MIIFIIILIILYTIIVYLHPWIDSYTDYRNIKHVVLWYTNFRGERKYYDLIGSQ